MEGFFIVVPRAHQQKLLLGALEGANASVMPRSSSEPVVCRVGDGAKFRQALEDMSISFQHHDNGESAGFCDGDSVSIIKGDILGKLLVGL